MTKSILKVIIMVVCMAVLFFGSVTEPLHAGGKKCGKTDKEILTHLKTVLWPKAYREKDTKLLDRILAKEFQMVDGLGNWSTKAQEMAGLPKGEWNPDKFEFKIKRLDIFENGTAVVAGMGYITNKREDGTYLTVYHSSNILIKRDGRWQAISSHVSGATETKQ